MENPIKMDDLGVPPFLETSIYTIHGSYGPIGFEVKKRVPSDPKSKGRNSDIPCCEAVTRAAAAKEMLKVELSRGFFLVPGVLCLLFSVPIGSMYGIFTYIWLIFMVNVDIYTIHGWYGVLVRNRCTTMQGKKQQPQIATVLATTTTTNTLKIYLYLHIFNICFFSIFFPRKNSESMNDVHLWVLFKSLAQVWSPLRLASISLRNGPENYITARFGIPGKMEPENLGGGFWYIFFMFTPKIGGRWTHFDEQIFQMGWNHQLVIQWKGLNNEPVLPTQVFRSSKGRHSLRAKSDS